MPGVIVTDGSAEADAEPTIEIDIADPVAGWRWTCPRGHSTIEPTNGGYWCRSCANAHDVEDPHYHELLDNRRDETVSWGRVRLTQSDPEAGWP